MFLKVSEYCAPISTRNFGVIAHLYLGQKRKYQGLPFNEKVNSLSKLNLLLPTEKSKMAAGLSNEKLGIKEMPLFVTPEEPDM